MIDWVGNITTGIWLKEKSSTYHSTVYIKISTTASKKRIVSKSTSTIYIVTISKMSKVIMVIKRLFSICTNSVFISSTYRKKLFYISYTSEEKSIFIFVGIIVPIITRISWFKKCIIYTSSTIFIKLVFRT